MSVLFVEYQRCSTCRKAHKWLDDHGVVFTDRSIVDDVPTKEELKAWQTRSGLPVKRFFNTCGVAYREANLKDRFKEGLSDDEAFDLLSANGMLIKRPLLVTDTTVIPGFNEQKWSEALAISE